jgi:hypothetical protein
MCRKQLVVENASQVHARHAAQRAVLIPSRLRQSSFVNRYSRLSTVARVVLAAALDELTSISEAQQKRRLRVGEARCCF